MEHVRTEKLPLRAKIGYGVGGFGSQMVYNNFIFWGMIFFTDYVGFSPAFAGMVIALGTLWDAVTDPTIGYLSDKRDPEKGRRIPFIVWFAIPLGITSMLIFTNVSFLGDLWQKIYFVVVILAFYTFQTCIDVPYTALGTEMTQDYDERSSLSAFRGAFFTINLIASNAMFILVAYLSGVFGGNWNIGWSVTGLLYGILVVASLVVVVKYTKGYELKEVGEIHKFNLKSLLVEPFNVKPFRYVTGMFVSVVLGVSIMNATAIYYLLNYMQFDEFKLTVFLMSVSISGLLGVPLINFMSRHMSKKVSWAIVMSLFAGSMFTYTILIFTPDSGWLVIESFAVLVGVGTGGYWQLIWSKVPDCVEVDEFKVGKRREGMFYGVVSLIQKVSAAIALLVVGLALEHIGYDAKLSVQSPETLEWLKILFGVGTAIPVSISIIIALSNPMTRERHSALNKALEEKRAGRAYSTEGFEELL